MTKSLSDNNQKDLGGKRLTDPVSMLETPSRGKFSNNSKRTQRKFNCLRCATLDGLASRQDRFKALSIALFVSTQCFS